MTKKEMLEQLEKRAEEAKEIPSEYVAIIINGKDYPIVELYAEDKSVRCILINDFEELLDTLLEYSECYTIVDLCEDAITEILDYFKNPDNLDKRKRAVKAGIEGENKKEE
ncbi:MAG: hypothetical protein ACOC56_06425 [Atribacterota bacterium]